MMHVFRMCEQFYMVLVRDCESVNISTHERETDMKVDAWNCEILKAICTWMEARCLGHTLIRLVNDYNFSVWWEESVLLLLVLQHHSFRMVPKPKSAFLLKKLLFCHMVVRVSELFVTVYYQCKNPSNSLLVVHIT